MRAISALMQDQPHSGEDRYRLLVPLTGGKSITLDGPDYRELTSGDRDPMPFERALVFARAGRRVHRRCWSDRPFGSLVIHDDQLQWELDATMGVMLPGEDLLATDWVVA